MRDPRLIERLSFLFYDSWSLLQPEVLINGVVADLNDAGIVGGQLSDLVQQIDYSQLVGVATGLPSRLTERRQHAGPAAHGTGLRGHRVQRVRPPHRLGGRRAAAPAGRTAPVHAGHPQLPRWSAPCSAGSSQWGTGSRCRSLGIPAAAVWGLLALVTNYVPNVGFVLGSCHRRCSVCWPAAGAAIAVVVVYSLLNFIVQTLIQPRFVGDSVGLSMTVTFVALLFWSWVMGALGALLAIPLTLLVKVMLVDLDPRGHWLDAVLREEPRAPRTMRAQRGCTHAGPRWRPSAGCTSPRAAPRPTPSPGRVDDPPQRAAPVHGGACGRPGSPCSASPSRRSPCWPASATPPPTPGSASRCSSWASTPSTCSPPGTWAGTSPSTARSTPPSPSAGGFLGQGAIIFASIWTNATSGFGQALLYTVVFGVLGVVLQAVAFVRWTCSSPAGWGST